MFVKTITDLLEELNNIPHGGGGGADSAHPQIVFFITSIREAVDLNVFAKLK